MSAVARAAKIIGRARSHQVAVDLDDEPIEAIEVGQQMLALTSRAQAHGIDAEQAIRDAVRALERSVVEAENRSGSKNGT